MLTINQVVRVFGLLNRHKAKYLVIGGIAAGIHGVPRNTKDLDLAIEPSRPNAQRVLKALEEAGLGSATLIDARGLLEKDVTIFNDVIPVDVLARPKGLVFREAWKRRVLRKLGRHQVPVASIQDLISMKRAAGRPIDLADLEYLEKLASQQGEGRT